MRSAIKYLYLFLGFLFLIIGIIGIVLPGLPTTPFLLLTMYFFAKASERVHNWFIGTPIYQKHLKNFQQKRSLTLKSKLAILSFSTPMMLIGIYFTPLIWAKWLIGAAILVHYAIFFFWIKTEPETAAIDKQSSPNQ